MIFRVTREVFELKILSELQILRTKMKEKISRFSLSIQNIQTNYSKLFYVLENFLRYQIQKQRSSISFPSRPQIFLLNQDWGSYGKRQPQQTRYQNNQQSLNQCIDYVSLSHMTPMTHTSRNKKRSNFKCHFLCEGWGTPKSLFTKKTNK